MGPWPAALQRQQSETLGVHEHQMMALRELPDSLHAETAGLGSEHTHHLIAEDAVLLVAEIVNHPA